ncbi:RNA-directed DNA polymerase, eukaryota, Reverse transcriptase zinc-binding domain protein [Artemisia annua]|uniref:RNA-directed DNA polymerase, eukaryota, Reverse transcriptase zinc-binding domain protein n=1 Tax=Artemisia annua TaxID=35608 RepID=A0A2U1QII1_ARTAN|nr:RNA-directed DNA polymerase, eukaryota, Reverse transcriptase zinc-binding domain protein [Artemisia annua]
MTPEALKEMVTKIVSVVLERTTIVYPGKETSIHNHESFMAYRSAHSRTSGRMTNAITNLNQEIKQGVIPKGNNQKRKLAEGEGINPTCCNFTNDQDCYRKHLEERMNYHRQWEFEQKTKEDFLTTPTTEGISRGNQPRCQKCEMHHTRDRTIKCMNCGKTGHKASDCKAPNRNGRSVTETDQSNFLDPGTYAKLVVQEKKPLLVWFTEVYKKFGCTLEFVTNSSREQWQNQELILGVAKKKRSLWRNLIFHKHYVRNRPWCLLGDFNSALSLEDRMEGSSVIDIAMREFKECVEEIEVFDVNRSGPQFTWNQKPRGMDGKLKKIDRIMANLACTDGFVGVHAIFQPYRISDHSPAILTIPASHKFTPRPFKFYNILVQNSQFKRKVKEYWDMDVSGFHMYKVVTLYQQNQCSSAGSLHYQQEHAYLLKHPSAGT